MARKSLTALARSRAPAFGLFVVEFDSPGMGHILAAAGCDYVFLDMEHSGFGIESVKRSLRGYEAAGLPSLVRPPSKAYHHIARVLDAGADGVCLPMVGSPEEAAEIVACAKYPPAGRRGIGLQIMHDRFAYGAPADKLAAADRRTCVVVQIETAEGAANVEAIAAVKGVDALWVGHYDLSASLGIPGRYDHEDYQAAIRRTIRACARHRKSLGVIAADVAQGLDQLKAGFNWIAYSTDAWLLRDGLRHGIDQLRAGAAKMARRSGKAGKGKK